MKQWTRPDGRCFVFGEPDADLPLGRMYATVDETDEARVSALAQLGFSFHRRELVLRLSTDPADWDVPTAEPPPGISSVPADRVDEERLRLLDDLLRQDVPGTDGWKWSPEGFRERDLLVRLRSGHVSRGSRRRHERDRHRPSVDETRRAAPRPDRRLPGLATEGCRARAARGRPDRCPEDLRA